MNRYNKKKLILESMATWDHETLLVWAQETMDLILDTYDNETLECEYQIALEEQNEQRS